MNALKYKRNWSFEQNVDVSFLDGRHETYPARTDNGAVLTEQSENIDLFHTALLDDSDDYYRDWLPQDAIVDKAFSEHGCPRWGMSW